MIIENERILMFEKSMNLGWSSQIVIQMCEELRCRAQKVIVCSMGGINTKKLEEIAVKHYDIRDISDKKNFFWNYQKLQSCYARYIHLPTFKDNIWKSEFE